MSSDSYSQDGYAARRPGSDGCLDTEIGETAWDGWSLCCPGDTSINELWCQYSDESDRETVDFPEQCANSSLALWEDGEVSWCCEEGEKGFRFYDGHKGCATEAEFDEGEEDELLTAVQQVTQSERTVTVFKSSFSTSTASAPTTPTDSISTSNTAAPTTSTSSEPSSSSASTSTNKGTIAGAVVGGAGGAFIIVGIVWFLLRLRKRHLARTSKPENPVPSTSQPEIPPDPREAIQPEGDSDPPAELDGNLRAELDGGSVPKKPVNDSVQPRYELPAPTGHE
ncbi:hypothetical protein P170DRAFT_481274 [Aspergillus steynii IBT 23096]|uniref:Uncharacterized protein n=1 Tax=Aspergillus steynii IBT 23096 TaxID=1392250 RepID=A0A2I2FRR5_9EURO|nr:uncharacterized protein P170DRAFT_481274 [Aspergillus steynii IBT 23096]PLB43325.1 hypothetical protein P170DRAFT_481274 [Aspergillus steynii IBT 23096]